MPPKPPPVEYVLTRPPDPGWWRRHRHQVYGTTGLLLGLWLCHSCASSAQDQPGHHPTPLPDPTNASVQPLKSP